MAINPREPSYLLRLPPELRHAIWKCAMLPPGPVTIAAKPGVDPSKPYSANSIRGLPASYDAVVVPEYDAEVLWNEIKLKNVDMSSVNAMDIPDQEFSFTTATTLRRVSRIISADIEYIHRDKPHLDLHLTWPGGLCVLAYKYPNLLRSVRTARIHGSFSMDEVAIIDTIPVIQRREAMKDILGFGWNIDSHGSQNVFAKQVKWFQCLDPGTCILQKEAVERAEVHVKALTKVVDHLLGKNTAFKQYKEQESTRITSQGRFRDLNGHSSVLKASDTGRKRPKSVRLFASPPERPEHPEQFWKDYLTPTLSLRMYYPDGPVNDNLIRLAPPWRCQCKVCMLHRDDYNVDLENSICCRHNHRVASPGYTGAQFQGDCPFETPWFENELQRYLANFANEREAWEYAPAEGSPRSTYQRIWHNELTPSIKALQRICGGIIQLNVLRGLRGTGIEILAIGNGLDGRKLTSAAPRFGTENQPAEGLEWVIG